MSHSIQLLLKKTLNRLISENRTPIYVRDADGMILQKVYFDDSKILTLLRYYPLFQFILIAFFVGFGYMVFSAARRSEQNQVWVGMAKETAHQLGTPISSLQGWVEVLKEEGSNPAITVELEKDINRLKLVSDRFGKIGSIPRTLIIFLAEPNRQLFLRFWILHAGRHPGN